MEDLQVKVELRAQNSEWQEELEGLFALIDKTRLAHGYLPSLCVGIEKTRQASEYSLMLSASSN